MKFKVSNRTCALFIEEHIILLMKQLKIMPVAYIHHMIFYVYDIEYAVLTNNY